MRLRSGRTYLEAMLPCVLGPDPDDGELPRSLEAQARVAELRDEIADHYACSRTCMAQFFGDPVCSICSELYTELQLAACRPM